MLYAKQQWGRSCRSVTAMQHFARPIVVRMFRWICGVVVVCWGYKVYKLRVTQHLINLRSKRFHIQTCIWIVSYFWEFEPSSSSSWSLLLGCLVNGRFPARNRGGTNYTVLFCDFTQSPRLGGRNSVNVLWALIFPIIPSCWIPHDLAVAVTSLLNVRTSLNSLEFHSWRIR